LKKDIIFFHKKDKINYKKRDSLTGYELLAKKERKCSIWSIIIKTNEMFSPGGQFKTDQQEKVRHGLIEGVHQHTVSWNDRYWESLPNTLFYGPDNTLNLLGKCILDLEYFKKFFQIYAR